MMLGIRAFLFLSVLILIQFDDVFGHGRLVEPVSRASMWRHGYNTPENYNDNQMFCGGFAHQVSLGYKCGMCGDPYDQNPRKHEAGGQYGSTNILTGNYTVSAVMNVSVQITANHQGYFEFKLFINNDFAKAITEKTTHYLLAETVSGATRIPLGSSNIGFYNYKLQLPSGVVCTQCVLQWRYHTGNSWGYLLNGTGCLGCGQQEEFYGCSDIAIRDSSATTTHAQTTTLLSSVLTTSTSIAPTTEGSMSSKPTQSSTTTTTTTKAAATTTTTTTTTSTTATTQSPNQLIKDKTRYIESDEGERMICVIID